MAKADFYLYIKAKPAANTELLCFFLTLKLYGWKSNLLLGRVEKNTIVLKQNSNVKIDNIKYIDCGGYGTLAAFSIGKLLYCKFNGNNKVSEVTQQDIAQLPSEYTLNSSIGVYRSVLVNARNTGSLQIDTYGKITLYCPYSYLYGYVIIPIK